jgi:hypothetical protein
VLQHRASQKASHGVKPVAGFFSSYGFGFGFGARLRDARCGGLRSALRSGPNTQGGAMKYRFIQAACLKRHGD